MKILSRNAILAKVEKLEKAAEFIRRCLKVRVCPNCGHSIEAVGIGGVKKEVNAFQCGNCTKFYSENIS